MQILHSRRRYVEYLKHGRQKAEAAGKYLLTVGFHMMPRTITTDPYVRWLHDSCYFLLIRISIRFYFPKPNSQKCSAVCSQWNQSLTLLKAEWDSQNFKHLWSSASIKTIYAYTKWYSRQNSREYFLYSVRIFEGTF